METATQKLERLKEIRRRAIHAKCYNKSNRVLAEIEELKRELEVLK